MLKLSYYTEPQEIDTIVFKKLIPGDHLLCQFKKVIDFEAFRELVKDCYSPDRGRSAEDPVRMIKLEILQFLYGLSDREVLKQLQVNVAYRYFLDLSLDSELPTSGLLSQFRQRLGQERHQALFEEVIRQARQLGLVKDRLRLKDATHVIANIAIPTTIQLVAQTRERLLRSAKPYAKERVAAEEQQAEEIRKVTVDLSDIERLWQRVEHLRRIVGWADEVQKSLGTLLEKADPRRERFDAMLVVAHRIVDESGDPDQKDRVVSSVDPDARCGKHGAFYDGYALDISMDADSELITAVDTPPANQDEAANAAHLVKQEQQAQGNRVEALSIDGIGFVGEVLRELKDPNGLGLVVYVPPREWTQAGHPYFAAADFHLTADGLTLVCPAEEETQARYRNGLDTSWHFQFTHRQCQACPLLCQCMAKLPATRGRQVNKNDYDAEYQAAREFAQTEAYTQVRQQHPKIERKLAEIIRYHAGRRTRFRGSWQVAIQYLLTTLVVNLKRMVRLLFIPAQASACGSVA
jgi:transposase